MFSRLLAKFCFVAIVDAFLQSLALLLAALLYVSHGIGNAQVSLFELDAFRQVRRFILSVARTQNTGCGWRLAAQA